MNIMTAIKRVAFIEEIYSSKRFAKKEKQVKDPQKVTEPNEKNFFETVHILPISPENGIYRST